MANTDKTTSGMTHYRWTICGMMFLALTVNYLDRQVLSLTWDEFIKPEFHWDESHYGMVTATFSIVYAIGMLFAGRVVDWLGTKRGFLWSIGIWSAGACLHAFCGIATEWQVGLADKAELIAATGDMAVLISTISMYFFLMARCVLAIGEAGYFPAAVKVTAEYFPKRDRAFATSIFNAGASIGALVAPLSIPYLAKAWGWELAFVIIGVLGFIWMGFWVFMYSAPAKSSFVNAAELAYIEQDKELEANLVEEPQAEEKKMSFQSARNTKTSPQIRKVMATISVPTVPMCLRMSPAGRYSLPGAASFAPITPPERASFGAPECPIPSGSVHCTMSWGHIAIRMVMPRMIAASAPQYPFRRVGMRRKLLPRQNSRNSVIG